MDTDIEKDMDRMGTQTEKMNMNIDGDTDTNICLLSDGKIGQVAGSRGGAGTGR
jgi:hypothetical protein